jgi:hypothetical protein
MMNKASKKKRVPRQLYIYQYAGDNRLSIEVVTPGFMLHIKARALKLRLQLN